ncbi:hypothetical protein PybrP1_007509 [[Pythium] brassicae (nom. inval.)]|nr:hypothetical protein PybrP1_007509 [[Pythium] brassicae (nom. inval.)]
MAGDAHARASNSAKQRRHYHRKQELRKTTLPAEKAALEQQLAALLLRGSSNSSVDVLLHAALFEQKSLDEIARRNWSLQKVLRQRLPRAIAQQTWAVWTNPERWVRLFSAHTEAHCRVLERVDSANVIVRQQFRDRQEEDWKQTRVLVTSATTSIGALLVMVPTLRSRSVEQFWLREAVALAVNWETAVHGAQQAERREA